MITVDIQNGHHEWEKQNLVTIMGKRGGYDIMKCKGCGMIGKRTNLASITLKASYSIEKINKCPAYKKPTEEENQKFKYHVIHSPWPNKLPVGTEIVPVDAPNNSGQDDWYKRKDGELLYKEEEHGCFRLYKNEVSKELI